MKLRLLFPILLFSAVSGFSQSSLSTFNTEKTGKTKKGMLVLGSWGILNIVTGAIGTASVNDQTKYFHQMNLIWGSANLLIAAPTYLGLLKRKQQLSLSQTLRAQAAIEKAFLFNGGLDLLYLSAGFYCLEKDKPLQHPGKYKGYGQSLLLQGGALLLLDAVMFFSHIMHGKILYKILDSLGPAKNGLGFTLPL